jgi:hypothetical protein
MLIIGDCNGEWGESPLTRTNGILPWIALRTGLDSGTRAFISSGTQRPRNHTQVIGLMHFSCVTGGWDRVHVQGYLFADLLVIYDRKLRIFTSTTNTTKSKPETK